MTKVINWERVEQSLVLHHNGNDNFAEALLLSAITEEETPVEPEEEIEVVYGANGNYTNDLDPRNPSNSRRHVQNQSIHLTVHANSTNKYRASYVESIFDSNGNNGRHVARVTVPTGFNGKVILAYPYGGGEDFANEIPHAVGQEIVISSGFNPPALGPLAIYLKEDGKRISDIVANIGLPNKEHVSFNISFDEN
ncbi:MAG: hypothetical protein E6Q36_05345 [Chryseobacterium sp.]|nr:MAG: hypothetical protein E6Q36_05345 [Chryseobacterium sp.]